MTSSAKKERLKHHYHDGFSKGLDDALRGIPPKHISHILRLSSAYMKEWENGYLEGYRSGINHLKKK